MHTASFLPQTYAALPEVGSTIAGLAPAHCMRTHSHRRKLMDAVRRGLLVFLLALWIVPQGASAKEQEVRVYLFSASSCPGCDGARSFLEKARQDDPKIALEDLDVEGTFANALLFDRIYERIGMAGFGALPLIIIGTHVMIGYDDEVGAEILSHIRSCRERECLDIVEAVRRELSEELEQASRCPPTLPAAQWRVALGWCKQESNSLGR
jgi:hypothetical protein